MITDIASKIGVRESRRVVGRYTLTADDILAEKTFPDAICVGQYPIDPWDPEGNPLHQKRDVRTPPYEIPYRCLITNKVRNLWIAGRAISGSHIANSSFRVTNIVAVTGQVAGIAGCR